METPNDIEAVKWYAADWRAAFERAVQQYNFYNLRALRISVFRTTLQAVRAGGYVTEAGEAVRLELNPHLFEQTRFYTHEIHPAAPATEQETQVAAVQADCLDFAHRLVEAGEEVCVLNLASRRNPGGGVLEGSGAQEEYLFRCSDYYRSLYPFVPYGPNYGVPRAKQSYPMDRNFGGSFSPGVTIFRGTEEAGYPLLRQPWRVNFMAVAGMNRPELHRVEGEERIADHLLEGMKNKMRTIFRIALDNGQHTLVLGAFGCGAFGNPPKHVAELFNEVLHEPEFAKAFRRIFFAIKEDHHSRGKGNFAPFKEVFGE